MSDDDEDSSSAGLVRREIDESIVTALRAKRLYQKRASAGGASPSVKSTLRGATIDLYNSLEWWQDEEQIQEQWEEAELDKFGELLKKQRTTPRTRNSRLSQPATQSQHLLVAELSAGQLIQYLDELLNIAREIGFAPAIDEPPTQTEIDDEMVEEVEEWRQSNLE